ncbi:hypothetical protein AB0L00_28010 [Actinoallomurus sp. NPDC052308]|uniref:hypothetical protein n=1 Tax=Actinoallomurus sp. NPDC052308 TaxID=3155530 RepID=UPI003414A60D
MPNNPRTARLDLQEATTRNDTARHIIAAFADALPTLTVHWRIIDTSLSDIAALAAIVSAVRLDHANLTAAARATLAAYADGEADHLAYLRDELHAQAERRAAR